MASVKRPRGSAAEPVVRVSVHAKPRASRSRIVKAQGLSVEAALAAPPVDGAANAELLVLLSAALGLPKSALRLVLGESSKHKVVEFFGLAPEEAQRRLLAAVRSASE